MKYMQTRILKIGLSVLLVVVSGVAWAEDAKLDGKNAWHGDAAFGLSLARGNANTFLMNASVTANRAWDQNELKLGADGRYGLDNFGKTNETQSVNSIHGFGNYKRLLTERFYGSANIDGFHDDIAEVRYRLIVGPAIGYYFIKTDATKLSGEIGPSFLTEKLGSKTMSFVALRVSERYEHALTKASKVWEQVDYLPQVDDFNNYLVNAEVGIEAALNTRFSLRVVAADNFNSRPAAGEKQNDITLVSSLVYKY